MVNATIAIVVVMSVQLGSGTIGLSVGAPEFFPHRVVLPEKMAVGLTEAEGSPAGVVDGTGEDPPTESGEESCYRGNPDGA